jgi:hypothetical protein
MPFFAPKGARFNSQREFTSQCCHSERSRGISQENDEARMSNDELMTNDEPETEGDYS